MLKRLLAVLCVALVLIPVRPSAASAAGAVWHVVRPGDTMSGIAAKFGLRTTDLARWNQVPKPYPVYVDGVLRLNPPPSPLPAWRTRVELVTPGMVNWDPLKKCPVTPAQLRRVWVSYVDFNGAYHDGSIIVRQDVVARAQRIFQTLYRWRYRIMAMSPMSVNMPGQTDMSIVTAGYNCRPVGGTKVWSEHATGTAIDINPLQNPMIRGRVVAPAAGEFYLNRQRYLIGMLHGDGAARAFTANGLHWGGYWRSLRDYMHFSLTNR
ncbi:MAG: M15 family metallopeptidase [Actinoplanes sp.]